MLNINIEVASAQAHLRKPAGRKEKKSPFKGESDRRLHLYCAAQALYTACCPEESFMPGMWMHDPDEWERVGVRFGDAIERIRGLPEEVRFK